MLKLQNNRQWHVWGVGVLCALGAGGAAAQQDARGVVVRPESAGAAVQEQSFIDPQLKMLWLEYVRGGGNLSTPADSGKGFVGPRVVDGAVRIEAMSLGDDAALADDLRKLGVADVRQQGNLVLGRIAVAGIDALQSLRTARFVRPAREPIGRVGSVTSRGDQVQGSAQARRIFGLDGSGVMVGVISTGYDTRGGAAADIASGDLPGPANPYGRLKPVRVLKEKKSRDSDEGRAMLQIIHDVAPGAELAIYIPENEREHADGLRALADAGANVIANDLIWLGDSWFQESFISATQREIMASHNVVVVNAAGNSDDMSVEGTFRPLPARDLLFRGTSLGRWQLHDWGNGQVTFPVTIRRGGSVSIMLQWDEPFATFSRSRTGSASDLDIFTFVEPQAVNIGFLSATRNVGADPYESINAFLTEDASDDVFTLYVGVGMPEGVGALPGRFKIIAVTENDRVDWPRDRAFRSSTVVGLSASEGAISACSARIGTGRGPMPEAASSVGGFARTRDVDGHLLPQPLDTHKPDVCAPDGVATTFFGSVTGDDGWPRFYGTSAAAPHLAGVASLMLQASGMNMRADEVGTVLRQTAWDMVDFDDWRVGPGYDLKTGHGFVNTELAVSGAMPLRYRR
ncbi:hypothetical protein M5C99_03765 [Acidovorax sp. NCPPB 2350]|nr:hypothetical protein M5C99_03765 [Acidovorax sp. NCPPB 2350]